MSIWITSLPYY